MPTLIGAAMIAAAILLSTLIGTVGNRYGIVETLPPTFVHVARTGLTGSYILGCASARDCVH